MVAGAARAVASRAAVLCLRGLWGDPARWPLVMPVGLQPNNRALVARGNCPLAALPLQPANAPSPTYSPTPQLIPYMAGLPAAERERVMATVLQLLAGGIITPYSGESKERARALLPVTACVLVACRQFSLPGHPFAASPSGGGPLEHNFSPPTPPARLQASASRLTRWWPLPRPPRWMPAAARCCWRAEHAQHSMHDGTAEQPHTASAANWPAGVAPISCTCDQSLLLKQLPGTNCCPRRLATNKL